MGQPSEQWVGQVHLGPAADDDVAIVAALWTSECRERRHESIDSPVEGGPVGISEGLRGGGDVQRARSALLEFAEEPWDRFRWRVSIDVRQQPRLEVLEVGRAHLPVTELLGYSARESAACQVLLPCDVVPIDVERDGLEAATNSRFLQVRGVYGLQQVQVSTGSDEVVAEAHRSHVSKAAGIFQSGPPCEQVRGSVSPLDPATAGRHNGVVSEGSPVAGSLQGCGPAGYLGDLIE
ncbi:unannotated protein [freshwater metagenome]|uniref:Unannotated protein n=1 Tax=freshwater metagenome TaxID=449393 RepID=A0A6J7M1L2_9ZZZZ